MTLATIKVIVLFFIAINLFFILVFLGLLVNRFFKYKEIIKIKTESEANLDLVQVIASYCEYSRQKGDKQVRLTQLNKFLSESVIQCLERKYGLRVVLNGLSEICVRD